MVNRTQGNQKTSETLSTWGHLPSDIIALLKKREWDNRSRLRARLAGTLPFPLEIGLKPPNGETALSDLTHFQTFVQTWKTSHCSPYVHWETRRFRQLGEQRLPIKMRLTDIQALAHCLGKTAMEDLSLWQTCLSQLLCWAKTSPEQQKALFQAGISQLDALTALTLNERTALQQLLPQLQPNLGQGTYLRALPVVGVDTKFIEQNTVLIEILLDAYHKGSVSSVGLVSWLGCQVPPRDWLLVRPLCPQVQTKLGGLPILRLDSQTLKRLPLPAKRLLVVENEQSALALPQLTHTVAVAGGGMNTAWLAAYWLATRSIAYWGDIDAAGLGILNDVRRRQQKVHALMMNKITVLRFQRSMVADTSVPLETSEHLTTEERELLEELKDLPKGRLEQEKLTAAYIGEQLIEWINNTIV